MNPEIKAEWVRRLRSGEVEQTQSTLRRRFNDGRVGYCCLGVLCEMAVEAGEAERFDSVSSLNSRYASKTGGFGSTAILPGGVAEWAGLSQPDPAVNQWPVSTRRVTLSEANDKGLPFADIADLIERDL